MTKPTHDIHLDFETYCDLDLKKVGVYRYVEHASFRVLCVAWKLDGRATLATCLTASRQMLPPDLTQALKNPDVQGHAWNAAFEEAVLKQLDVFVANPLSCTMQRALAYGLPARLEAAAGALGVRAQKDMAGHRLMLKMSRPLKPGETAWPLSSYEALADYCAKDVEAEAAVGDVIPPLMPEEWELSQIDAAMNIGGELGADLSRVKDLQVVAQAAEKIDAARCAVLTGDMVTSPGTQTAKLLLWLSTMGMAPPDTQRATIEEMLLEDNGSVVKEVLEIRLRMARASTKKLQRMLDMAGPGGSLRGQFQFVGAGRTGRWSGRGVQVQNLPRVPKGFSPTMFAEMARASALSRDVTGMEAIAPAPVLDCVSWSLRSCLKAADDGCVLWSFDFSQIEARVLAWLAGQRDVLAVFASGDDVYVWAAAQFGSTDRQLGKVLILALGFGMGAIKLRETSRKAYGVVMTASEAEKFKSEWRARNPRIVGFWYAMEDAAKAAILRPGEVRAVGGSGVAFICTSRTLQMRLPSGRVLYYHAPRLDQESGSIVYWGTEVGGRWGEQRTWGGKLAENATQAAARDVMSEAMLRVWGRDGCVPCMTVHDELVYALIGEHTIEDVPKLEALMLELPPWAGGLPLAGEHKIMRRYGVAEPDMVIAKAA